MIPVKILNYLKRSYFNFIATDNEISHQGVCFSREKYNCFTSIEKQQTSNSGIKLKKFRMNGNDDIVANRFTSVKKVRASFQGEKNSRRTFPLIAT